MTTLPALRAPTPIEPRLERLSIVVHDLSLTRRAFILACLGLVLGRVADLFDRLARLPLFRIRFQ